MTGRYQAYPEYKDSELRLFDDIPKHWSISKVRFISSFGRGLPITKADLKDKGIPCVSYGEVHSRFGFEVDPSQNNLKCVDENYLKTSPFALLSKGDFIFADTSEDIDGSGNFTQLVSDEILFAGYHTVIVRPTSDNYYRFLAYVFDSPEYRTQVRDAVKGVKVFSVTQAILKNTNVWLPSYEEQQKIANFLDHETTKIEILIAKQEKLIELLKEKRHAVISHAVTRGLNPDAPMKDSGVEWLGEVPQHWVVSKFGYQSLIVRGGSPRPAGDPTLFNGSYSPWVTVAEITKDDEINLTGTNTFLTEKGSKQCRVFTKGTLIISNSGATLGVPKILSINANANDGVVGFENLNINSEYCYFYLSSLTEGLRDRIKQGSGQPNLNTDIIKDIQIPLPPEAEVVEIVNHIKDVRETFSILTKKAAKAIGLMRERKTALISAAVTGKIDVRNYEAEKAGN